MYIRNIKQAQLQKVFANKIERVQLCIDARGDHFHRLSLVHSDFPNARYFDQCVKFGHRGFKLLTAPDFLRCPIRSQQGKSPVTRHVTRSFWQFTTKWHMQNIVNFILTAPKHLNNESYRGNGVMATRVLNKDAIFELRSFFFSHFVTLQYFLHKVWAIICCCTTDNLTER